MTQAIDTDSPSELRRLLQHARKATKEFAALADAIEGLLPL